MDCEICGKELDLDRHGYFPGTFNGEQVYAHIKCCVQDQQDQTELTDDLDATDLSFDLDPIVWTYDRIVVGARVEITIRRYEANLFCWVATFDDGGGQYSKCGTGAESTLEDAKREAEGFVLWYLLYY